jgi:hypothetical protein
VVQGKRTPNAETIELQSKCRRDSIRALPIADLEPGKKLIMICMHKLSKYSLKNLCRQFIDARAASEALEEFCNQSRPAGAAALNGSGKRD